MLSRQDDPQVARRYLHLALNLLFLGTSAVSDLLKGKVRWPYDAGHDIQAQPLADRIRVPLNWDWTISGGLGALVDCLRQFRYLGPQSANILVDLFVEFAASVRGVVEEFE